jgi:hypothetical protein
VVDLAHHGDAVARQSVDQVQLPEGSRSIEGPCVDPRHLLGQLGVGSRRGQRDLAHVKLEVEVRIVDPVAVVEVERHLGQPPPERRHEREALGDQVLEPRQRQPAVLGRGRVVDRERAHVTVVARVLEREELLVERGELAHCF